MIKQYQYNVCVCVIYPCMVFFPFRSEQFCDHAPGRAASNVLNSGQVAGDNCVVVLEDGEVLLPETFPCSFTHDHAMLALLIGEHNHVATHVLHLVIVNVNNFSRMNVLLGVADFLDYMISLFFVSN
jgi:hypothetical protein